MQCALEAYSPNPAPPLSGLYKMYLGQLGRSLELAGKDSHRPVSRYLGTFKHRSAENGPQSSDVWSFVIVLGVTLVNSK